MTHRGFFSSYCLPTLVCLLYLFLYTPIIVLMAYSFNESALGYKWSGFTFLWHLELLSSDELWGPLSTSLMVACASMVLSVSMASLYVFFQERLVPGWVLYLFYASLGIPEVVLAVGLLGFFYFFTVPLGMLTLIIAHTVLGLGYVVPIIQSRYAEFNKRLLEASLDLGATPVQTFFRIILPFMMPALSAGAMLVFIISFDDFTLSFFCAGAQTQTLPLYIFSRLREGASPDITALSTLLLIVSSFFIFVFSSIQARKGRVK